MPPFADVLQWEHLPFPKSLRDFQRLFATDEACARYLEGAKWPKGFVCPHCGEKGEPVRLRWTAIMTDQPLGIACSNRISMAQVMLLAP